MVHRADGGAVGDGSGVGYKLHLEVNSLRVLADQIADDLSDFDAEFEDWNQQRHYSHPLSAQYTRKEGGFSIFEEANLLDGANRGSHQQVVVGVQLVRKGLEALHKAADNLAKTYQNLDEANAIDVAAIQWLFPEPKPAAGGGGRELPSPEQMQQAIHPDGFDLDGDGVVDPDKGDILFAPTTAKPSQLADGKSTNDTPADVPLDTHGGYARPVDETMPTQESGGFSEEVREEYAEQLAEEPVIMAPGAPGTDPGSPATPSGTVTA